MRDIQFYQANSKQDPPTHDRSSYYATYNNVRRWRRQGIARMEVLWYASSLSLDPWSAEVTRREAYDWQERRWYVAEVRSAEVRNLSCLRVAVNGPVGKLP